MAMVVVKWSTCLPSTVTNWVRIPIKPTVFSVKFVFEKNKNKLKEARLVNFFKKSNKIHFKNALTKRLHVEMCSQEAKYGSRVDRTLNAPLCYEKEVSFRSLQGNSLAKLSDKNKANISKQLGSILI